MYARDRMWRRNWRPQLRGGCGPLFVHFSLKPENFLGAVNAILADTLQVAHSNSIHRSPHTGAL
jgi:hypothetical protein